MARTLVNVIDSVALADLSQCADDGKKTNYVSKYGYLPAMAYCIIGQLTSEGHAERANSVAKARVGLLMQSLDPNLVGKLVRPRILIYTERC